MRDENQTVFLYFGVSLTCGACLGWTLRTRSTFLFFNNVFSRQIHGSHKLVLVTPASLKLSKGKLGAQCAHASVMAYKQCSLIKPKVLDRWLNQGQPKVVLQVKNESQLLDLKKTASDSGFMVSLVQDAGRTEVKPGTYTVLAIGPDTTDNIDSLTGQLKLL